MIRIILLIFLAFPLAVAGECESLNSSFSDEETTLSVCKEGAEAGDSVAQFYLGKIYFEGIGVATDKEEGLKWIRQSAEQGYDVAQYLLGLLYRDGVKSRLGGNIFFSIGSFTVSFDDGYILKANKEKALKWLRLAADQGHADAQVAYGAYYVDDGLGVKEDLQEAFKWFSLAAEQGDRNGQLFLGEVYFLGRGVEKDYAEAFKWHRLAAEQGVVKSQFHAGLMLYFGRGVEQNYAESLKWFRLAAAQGHVHSYYFVGSFYLYKHGVVERDYIEALKWLELFHEKEENPVEGGYLLGKLHYRYGDKAKGLELLKLAAKERNINAQTEIGWMYYHGEGVELDREKGRQLIYSSAEEGDPEAQSILGWMYYNGEGIEQDKEEALKWYRLSVANSYPHPSSSYELGVIYREGDIVEQDLRQSYIHFLIARDIDSHYIFTPLISTVRQPPEDVESEIKSLETLLTEEQITSAKQEAELMLQQ